MRDTVITIDTDAALRSQSLLALRERTGKPIRRKPGEHTLRVSHGVTLRLAGKAEAATVQLHSPLRRLIVERWVDGVADNHWEVLPTAEGEEPSPMPVQLSGRQKLSIRVADPEHAR